MKDAFELRDWLEGKNDGTSLSPQIREAVYVLQPRYAPAPNLDIEALLDQIEKENLGEESTFDTECVIKSATISDALPTKSISDVFASLEEGPLASPQKIPVSKEADIIPFPKRWVASIGGLIAVACALLFVMPLQQPLQQEAPANQLQKPVLRSIVQEDIKKKEFEDVDEAEAECLGEISGEA